LPAAARRAQTNQVDGHGKPKKKPAPRIQPIVVYRDGLAKDPRHETQNERNVGDLKKSAMFLVEAAKHPMHFRISF
jgi:hypothetical protein